MTRGLFVAAALLLTAGAAIPMAHAQYLPVPGYAPYAPYAYGYPAYAYGYGYYPPYAYAPSYYYSPSFPYNPAPGMSPESTSPRLLGSVKAP